MTSRYHDCLSYFEGAWFCKPVGLSCEQSECIGGWAGVAMNLGMTNPTDALGAAGGYAELVKYNAAPGGGGLNVFSL